MSNYALFDKDPCELTDDEYESLLNEPLDDLPPLGLADKGWLASAPGRRLSARAEASVDAVARAVGLDASPGWRALDAAAGRLGSRGALNHIAWRAGGLPALSRPLASGHARLGSGSGTVSTGPREGRVRVAWASGHLRIRSMMPGVFVEVQTSEEIVAGRLEMTAGPTWLFPLPVADPVRLLVWRIDPQTAVARLGLSTDELDPVLWSTLVGHLSSLVAGRSPGLDLSSWYDAWCSQTATRETRTTYAAACRLVELATGTPPVPAYSDPIGRRYLEMGGAVSVQAQGSMPSRRTLRCIQFPKTL